MIDRGVAKRYAHALFGAAVKVNALEAVLADMESLETMVVKDPRLVRFLESPQELDENKRALVEKLFRGRGHDLFVNLLLLLLRKKRVLHLLDVVVEYRKLVEEHQGIAEARVTTVVPLGEDLRRRLISRLEGVTGKKVKIRPRIDGRIIGGIIVMVEGKILDSSIRHELDRLREELLAARVR